LPPPHVSSDNPRRSHAQRNTLVDLILAFVDIVLHLDRHLADLTTNYGVWVYAILFLIIFCETGLVVTPFLPGDSLLFVTGALAGAGMLDPALLVLGLSAAAIIGNTTNYWIGRYVGPAVFERANSRWLRKEHLERTQRFYDKHGGKTIVITRFVPIVRTFAPFVAGIGRMAHLRFQGYNVAGGLLWVGSLVLAGYWFGDTPFVKNNLTAVILGIVFLSILPGIIEYIRHRLRTA
jgi:membrane-associated protein